MAPTKWPLFVYLIITVLSSSLLVATRNDCKKLRDLEFGLFGIRTTYGAARNYLRRSDQEDIPESFDDDSMFEEHADLKKDGCHPRMIYMVGRHSANIPNVIKHYERLFGLLVGLTGHIAEQSEHLDRYLDWRPSTWDMKHALNELGAAEERQLSLRLKRLYPEFFNTQTSNITFGFLNDSRSELTAREFLKQVDDDQHTSIPACLRHDHQQCSPEVRGAFFNPLLDFGSDCNDSKQVRSPENQVNQTQIRLHIARRVAARLGLRMDIQEHLFSLETFESVYRICKHESALYNDSIWCELFEKADFRALEYLDDFQSYQSEGYGPQVNLFQSCRLVKDILDSFQEIAANGQQNKTLKRAKFYFIHTNALRRLFATFGLFKDDQSYGLEAIDKFNQSLEVPQRRNWRSSLQVPYSANMALVLYSCSNSAQPTKVHKVLVTVNEQPVKLPACKGDTDCKLSDLLDGLKKWLQGCKGRVGVCAKLSQSKRRRRNLSNLVLFGTKITQ